MTDEFRIPEAARRELERREGLRRRAEEEGEPFCEEHETVGKCQKCSDSEEQLPSPDDNRIGKFQHPDAGAAVTQRKAAILAYPNTGTQRRKVLDAIGAAGERGMTDEELAETLKMLPNTERPRRVELEEDGWVMDSDKTRLTLASGREAVVWVLTDEGRKKWSPVEV